VTRSADLLSKNFAAPARPAPRRSLTLRQSEARAGIGLILPTVTIIVLVIVVPIVWTVVLAFKELKLIGLARADWFSDYSLQNFVTVFSARAFWSSLGTTLTYSIGGTLCSVGLGLIAALALRGKFPGRGLIRSAMLLPYIAPVVAVTFVWTTMLNPQFGIINVWGQTLFGWEEPIAFLSQRSSPVGFFGLTFEVPTALLTVIVYEMWRSFPFAFLFLTARLQAVPGVLEEAARVDGATLTQRFRHIVLPQLMPTIAVLVMLRLIWTFNNFDDVYLLTGGGAGTEMVSIRVFKFLTARGDIGAASAQALVLAAVLGLLVVVYLRFAAREESS
jgi:multiple sugar transport system permease protein